MSKKQMDLFEIPTDLPKPERKKLPHKPRELTRKERAEEAREKRLLEKEQRQRAAQEAKAKRPTLSELEKELERARRRRRVLSVWRNALIALLIVILVSLIFFPIMRVQGTDMEYTLSEGDLVLAMRTKNVKKGDAVLFSAGGGQQMIRRVIALPGDEVYISPEGIVMVNGWFVEESYVDLLMYGEADVEFPLIVPEGRLFVLSDNRASDADSRHDFPGMIAEEQLIGRVVLRLLPLENAGMIR